MLSEKNRFSLSNLLISIVFSFALSGLYYTSNILTFDNYTSFINGDTINQLYSKTADYRVIPLFLFCLLTSFIVFEKSRLAEKVYTHYKLNSFVFRLHLEPRVNKLAEFLIVIMFAYFSVKLIFLLIGYEHYTILRRNVLIFIFMTFMFFLKSRSLLVSQLPLSLAPLLYLREEYNFNGTLVQFDPSNSLILFLSIISFSIFLLTFVDIVKNKQKIAFSTLVFLSILLIGSTSRIYALDEYHIGELFTAFHQSFELNQSLYSEFIPTKGFMHIVVGFLNETLYAGDYLTIILSRTLFQLSLALCLLLVMNRYYPRWVICILLIIGVPFYGNYYPILIGLCVFSDKRINSNSYNFIILFFVFCFLYFLYLNAFALAFFASLIPILLYRMYTIFQLRLKPNKTQLLIILIGSGVFVYAFNYIIASVNYSLVNSSSNLFYWGNSGSPLKLIQNNLWVIIPIVISYLLYTKKIEKDVNNLIWCSFFILFPLVILSYMEGRADGVFNRAFTYSVFSSILLLSYITCNNVTLNKKTKVFLFVIPIFLLINIGGFPSRFIGHNYFNSFQIKNILGDMVLSKEGLIPNLGKGFINRSRYDDLLAEFELMNQLSKDETFLLVDPYTTDSARYSIYGKKIPTLSHAILNIPNLDSQNIELQKVKKMNVKIIRISLGINRYHLFYKYLTSLGYTFTTFNNRDYLIFPELFHEIKEQFDLKEKDFYKSQYTTVNFGLLPLKWGGAFKHEINKLTKNNISLKLSSLNDITEGDIYKLGNIDPFMVFNSSKLMAGISNELLYIEVEKNSDSVCSSQFFWDTGMGFNEANSILFQLGDGETIVPIGMNLNWLKSQNISAVRLDIDQCTGQKINLKNINFYSYNHGNQSS